MSVIFTGCSKNQSTQNVSEESLLFVSATCSHCANVKKFISDNGIQDKVQYREVEAFQNEENTNLFIEKSTICAIPNEDRGVPLFFDGGKCYLGEDDVISRLRTKANAK
jgi:glutaredoxin